VALLFAASGRLRFLATRLFFFTVPLFPTGGLLTDAALDLRIESTSFCLVLSVVVMYHLVDQLFYFCCGIIATGTHVIDAAAFESAVTIDRSPA
jgi:hypothetical protein